MTLWPHQSAALTYLRQSLASGHRHPMLALPTGGGKTKMAAAIVNGALRKGNRVVFTVPAIELVDQTVQAFYREGITEVGVLQADHHMTDRNKPVQIASVQTLARRGLPAADIVIVDEAHRAFKVIHDWMAKVTCPFVGLSATPWTKGLGKHYDDLIIAATTQELIDGGYLAPFKVFAPAHPDLTGVRTVAGDYHEGDLETAMDKPTLVADVVSTWLRLGENQPTLCFGVNKAHAKSLERQFTLAGVPAAYIDDHTDRIERDRIRKAFQRGDVKVVCNIGVLTTGVDWDVRCLILARPTKSEILYTQIIGRALRTAPGKSSALILDHSDTTLRLGFVTEIGHTALDLGVQTGKQVSRSVTARPKECPACAFLRPAKAIVCPACGFKPERINDVETAEGDLVQVGGKAAPKPKPTMIDKQAWYSGLLRISRGRGYKDGWAANKYREKFGVWPKGLKDVSAEPTMEVHSFVIASQIKYAKSRGKAA